jgi:two-component system sensor histidine kinase HydH
MKTVKKDLQALIVARLIVATTLLVAAVVIQFSTVSFLPLGPFYLLLAGPFGLSAAYLVLLRWNANYRMQAYIQIVFDLLIVTGLVYISGGIDGNLYVLYAFVIAAASVILGRRAAFLTAALAAILFGGLADGLVYGVIPYFQPGQAPDLATGQALYAVFLAWSLFFVVAVMVNYLSQSLRRTRQALTDARRELDIKERQAAAGRMSALIAHEIRNPLAAISGSVQVLKDELTLGPEQVRLMDIVVNESRRVSESIDQFLSLASPARHVFVDFDLSQVVGETMTMLRMSGDLNGHILVDGNFATTRMRFFGDPNQFKQVTWNLARNAFRAMPDGGRLTVDFSRDGREELLIRFRDNGRGMTAEDRSRMFEPFYTRFEGGQGLGLAVVRKIVDDYHGRIDVRSEPGAGTEIVIALPQHRSRFIGGERGLS